MVVPHWPVMPLPGSPHDMTALRSGLYVGQVTHRRVRVREHTLAYRAFYLLLDLSELPRVRQWPWFSVNRRGLMAWHDRDHGDGTGEPFQDWLVRLLESRGFLHPDWRFEVLCLPRVFGYVFNPITVVYCYSAAGLQALVYEVNNTFGQRIHYVLPARAEGRRIARQRVDKALYVSPFFDVAGNYVFDLTMPADSLALSIRHEDAAGLRLHAAFTGRRIAWSGQALRRVLLSFPLMTFKVFAGIHREAFRLWRKGLPIHPRPEPPESAPHA